MTEAWYYSPGNYYQLDDLSGFKVRSTKTRTIPGGQTGNLIVDRKRWEPQQPQDFVRGVPDDQTVPQPRTRQPNRYMVVATFVTAYAARGDQTITVDSVVGMAVGDQLQIMLDSGVNFLSPISSLSGQQIGLTLALPASVGAAAGNLENSVIDLTAPTRPLGWRG